MLFKKTLFILVLFSAQYSFCQLPIVQWAKPFQPANTTNPSVNSNSRAVAVDRQGNVYSTGLFQYAVDFDPGPGTFVLSASNQYHTGIFISKLSPTGDFIWAKEIAISVEWSAIEMALDANDNVYITSIMNENVDMDPGPGVHMANLIGVKDAFVLKLDTNGDFVWVKQFGGGGPTGDTVPTGSAITVDKDGNIITCGDFNNTVDFDPGPGTFFMSAVHTKGYVVKLTNDGDFIWAKTLGSSTEVYSSAHVNDMKCDPQGNIYTTGNCSGICDYDPGPGVYLLAGTTIIAGFASKLDPDGNFVFAKRIGSNEDYYNLMMPTGLDLDPYNNVYITGTFEQTQDFDPGPNEYKLTAMNMDTYILKLSEQGEFIWARRFGGIEGDQGVDIAVDNAGNAYSTGNYSKDVDFDLGLGTNILYNLDFETVIVKLDNNGDFKYAAPLLGTSGTGNEVSMGRRIITDNSQSLYITGYVGGVIDVDPGPGVYPLDGAYPISPFVLKYLRCQNVTTYSLSISTCNSYTLNNYTYTASGTYIQTIPNSSGCDSIITLHLTINRKFTTQTKTICEGQSFYAGGAYQTVAGVYKDTLLTQLGCDSIITTALVVNLLPKPNLGPDRKLCVNGYSLITPGMFNSYQWQDGSIQPDLKISSMGTYWVTVTNAYNCKATDTLKVIAVDTLPANFLPKDQLMCMGSSIQITLPGYKTYTWSTGDISSSIHVSAFSSYYLTVTDNNNCTGKDTIVIQRDPHCIPISIPNSFTPDKNGKNDIFKPIITQDVRAYHFIIFNRYGEKVFETNDPSKGWDGTYKGMDQPMNSYTYFIRFTNSRGYLSENTGSVLLIR